MVEVKRELVGLTNEIRKQSWLDVSGLRQSLNGVLKTMQAPGVEMFLSEVTAVRQ